MIWFKRNLPTPMVESTIESINSISGALAAFKSKLPKGASPVNVRFGSDGKCEDTQMLKRWAWLEWEEKTEETAKDSDG